MNKDRFKFRVFDKSAETMIYFDFWEKIDNYFMWKNRVYESMFDRPKQYQECFSQIMQSSGHRDFNGKLIYECDILKSPNASLYEVWFDTGFEVTSLSQFKPDKQGFDNPPWEIVCDSYSVIGNKYENPHIHEKFL
jgi:hypothetical protein